MLRTRTCGELRAAHVGRAATLCGWVDSYRDHHGVVFVDLRDRWGKTQIAFRLDLAADIQELARSLRLEDVIRVTGDVAHRGEDRVNPKLETGAVELHAAQLEVLNRSRTPPFQPGTSELPNEELRLTYRFLDLRRRELQRALRVRHQVCKLTRDYFDSHDFLEIETPMLGRSTPEGARDYLVPSRVHPGSFYALPQSPQIYKQILMVSGCDRYFQLARCFRDEDLRADRQPEFTQIDVEMAFVDRDDILDEIDGLLAHLVQGIRGETLQLPLPRYQHREMLERYGSDKPDLRFGMELVDISGIAAASDFGVFKTAVASGGRVRGIRAPGAADRYSRRMIEEDLTRIAADFGAKGLAFFKVVGGKLESTIAKFFSDEQRQEILRAFGAADGDLLLFVAAADAVSSPALAALRNHLGRELKLYDPRELNCLWVVDFPLVTWNKDENRWDAEHHPFCSVMPEDVPLIQSDPGKVRALSYDLVVNGYEAASGSIRIHDPKVQQSVFDLLGISEEQAEARFGFLLEALRYGAPPHGGIALGLDRWVMLFCGYDNIRDVIAFPKTQKASDLLSGAPSPVDDRQLRELSIRVELPQG
ncbi:MAG: aspartate--tRNA ligase [Planctomycetes bacterium]|nr:aspartate--tRNA ligase [Planctomycetota bacterium]